MSLNLIIGDNNFDHLLKVVSAEVLNYKGIFLPFAINR